MNPFDEMTREDRRKLYNPANYEVNQTSSGNWNVQHSELGVWFQANHSGPKELRILSESGKEYYVNQGACSCPDFINGAMRENRLCKHAAVFYAIADFQRKKKEKEMALGGAQFQRMRK